MLISGTLNNSSNSLYSKYLGNFLSFLGPFINKNILLSKNRFFKIIINLLFILDHILIYFIFMSKINNSILHPYFFITFVLGIVFYIKFYHEID